MSSQTHQAAAALARAVRIANRDPSRAPLVLERRRELAETKIRERIEEVIATAPPLTPEQADRLAALLRPNGS